MAEKTVKIQKATADALHSYGDFISSTGGEPAFDSEVFSFWNDLALGEFDGTESFGMVLTKTGEMTAPMLERHLQTTETLVPLQEEIVLVLAKPSADPREDDWPDLDTLAAFRIPTGTAVTLKKGTWHYIPLVPGKSPARTLVVFRQGTPAEDLEVRQLQEEKDTVIRVVD